MRPLEIARSYDRIAERWSSERFPRRNGIAQHERAIAFLDRKRCALDVGCGGSGRLIELFANHGFEPEGLDISRRMIELARARHPAVTFHLADITEWTFPKRYDLVSAWDSVWHVPLGEQEPVLRKLLEGLAPGGVLVVTMGGLDGPAEKVDSAMGAPLYYATLGLPRTLELLAAAGSICRHLEYDQYPESHVCLIAQKA